MDSRVVCTYMRWPAPECALALAWAPPAPWGRAQLGVLRQSEGTAEAAHLSLRAPHLVAVLGLLAHLMLARDGQHIVVQLDMDVFGRETGSVCQQFECILALHHVEGMARVRRNGCQGQVAVAAQRVAQDV
eukprot:349668-Chlamydomonas_euryale.AAC.1